jgi:hypothetical protein
MRIVGLVALLVLVTVALACTADAWAGNAAGNAAGGRLRVPHGAAGERTLLQRAAHAHATAPARATGNRRAAAIKLARVGKPGPPFYFRLPIRFHDGVPMVAIALSDQPRPFVCVVDTGSLHLNVSADICNVCDTTRGVFLSTPVLEAAPESWLRYGTQHDVVKKVPGFVQLHTDTAPQPLDVHVTVERSMAESNYNVLGLLRGPGSFMDSVLPPGAGLYIRFLQDRGFLAAVEPHIARRLYGHAAVRAPLLQTDTNFYVVELSGVRVGGHRPVHLPKYLLLDTGSNMTSFPAAVYRQMLPHLNRGEPLTLEVAGQPLTIAADTYRWQGTRELMIDDDLSILADSPEYVILGAHLMQHLNLLFLRNELVVTLAVPDAEGRVPDDVHLCA